MFNKLCHTHTFLDLTVSGTPRSEEVAQSEVGWVPEAEGKDELLDPLLASQGPALTSTSAIGSALPDTPRSTGHTEPSHSPL